MTDHIRDELIQVAAVAVAIIQDIDHGSTEMTIHTPREAKTDAILDEVERERHRQEAKWGPQHHDPPVWLAILMEEVGEAAQAWLQSTAAEGSE